MSKELLEKFLIEILSSDKKQAAWLCSLSYLEHIGYRKMVKTVSYEQMDPEVFKHLSDEVRHSKILKELAEKEFPDFILSNEQFETLQSIAETYFQGIDKETEDWLAESYEAENPYLCYLWVSYLVEKRAMRVYPAYFAKLKSGAIREALQQLIRDESEHLSALEKNLEVLAQMSQPFKRFGSLSGREEKCFADYLSKMQQWFLTL